ncbi:MAG: isocitrate lyase/phosphoenolpyruvate mutase family protein [Alphaproteobacteria bacterium]|nr:isocitrate lyase/phosphoenolpyruvate mutase family protein [Alphaproteobacteria bacterium]
MSEHDRKSAAFVEAHRRPGIIVLPNAWDVGSAIIMAEAGFPAIATTSAGVAFAQGLPDGQAMSREAMLEIAGRIAAAVPIPVTADLEAGYGKAPEDVAATVKAAIAAGLAGCNIEDSTNDPDHPLLDIGLATDRIKAGAEAARASGHPFVLNARADPLLSRGGFDETKFAEAVKRANAYRSAGADCLFVPGPMDAGTIGRLVREIDGPLNVLGARGGQRSELTVADLEKLGVKRISIGGSLSVAVLGFVRRAVAQIRDQGVFDYGDGALSNAEVNRIMKSYRSR